MKKLPEIFVNNINKNISHNDEVYYSYKDHHIEEKHNIKKVDFKEDDFIIISKSYDYLLTIDGDKIMIKDILEIY